MLYGIFVTLPYAKGTLSLDPVISPSYGASLIVGTVPGH